MIVSVIELPHLVVGALVGPTLPKLDVLATVLRVGSSDLSGRPVARASLPSRLRGKVVALTGVDGMAR